MKNLILTIALVLTSLTSFAQNGQNITITIDNVKNTKGKVGFVLHNKATFMKPIGIMKIDTEIESKTVTVTFKDVKPGEYAIVALHDENGNNNMDFSEKGMPLEDYGASNNVMSFGPPQYSDAKFELKNEDLELNIRF